MSKNKGITLISLIIYIIVMLIAATIVGNIIAFFLQILSNEADINYDIGELNKINMYLVKEMNIENNRIVNINTSGNEITFLSGNKYTFINNSIYINTYKISSNIENCTFSKIDNSEKEIINVNIIIGKGDNAYIQNMQYMIKDFYNNIKVNKPRLDYFNSNSTYFVTFSEDENTGTATENSTNKISETEPQSWYDYSLGEKKWANIKTVGNGKTAYWVWIPRYAYKIIYYTDELKTTISNNKTIYADIDIKFLKNASNIPFGEIEEIDSSWIVHSGFNFDDNQLEGIWVAKYKASGVADNINIISSGTRMITDINTAFIESRKLETVGGTLGLNMPTTDISNIDYTDTTPNIDTHLLKNTEWGAVTYLTYYTNENSDINSIASSTGNEYGIYDLIDENGEFISAYYNENRVDIIGYADIRYKTIYTTYNNLSNIKGNAIYETSILDSGNNSIAGASSVFLDNINKLLIRGQGGIMGYNAINANGLFRSALICK